MTKEELQNLIKNEKVVLAPMAGITSFAYRKFMHEYGINIAVTEMVSDMGLIYDNDETKNYVIFPKIEGLVTGVQLFGNSVENIKNAAKIALNLNPDIDYFDINMACPVSKIIKQNSGSYLMKDPKKCGDIVKAVIQETSKPVTAKIRLGIDDKHLNYFEVIKELEKAGVAAISLHARTTKDLYTGTPKFELIRNLQNEINVPLMISGNIYSLDDAKNAMKLTGADAVLIARGGVGNPLLIQDIKNNKQINTSYTDQKQRCLYLAKLICEEKGESCGMRIFRGIAPKFFTGFNESKTLRSELASKLNYYSDLEKIFSNFEQNKQN